LQGTFEKKQLYSDRGALLCNQVTWPSLTTASRKCRQELVSDIDAVEDFNVGNLSLDYVNEQHPFGCV
jgi:hypothetical protein